MPSLRLLLATGLPAIASLSTHQAPVLAVGGAQPIIRLVCNGSSWTLIGPGYRIYSTRQFVASGDRVFPRAVRDARRLRQPRYWVSSTTQLQDTCPGRRVISIELGVNSRNHTYLMAVSLAPLSQRARPPISPVSPGKVWSTWLPEGGVRAPDHRPVAYLARVLAALAQSMYAVFPDHIGPDQVLSWLQYRGSGHRVIVTTIRCVNVARCSQIVDSGQRVTLAHGRHVGVSVGPMKGARQRVMWIQQGLLIRIASDLPVWWVERLAEHVAIIR